MPLAAPVKLLTNMMYSCWPFWGPTFAWGRAGDAKSHDAQPPVSVEVRFQKPWDPSGAFLLPACRVHYETVSFSRDLPRVLFHSATTPVPQLLSALFRAATMLFCGGLWRLQNDKKCLCRRHCGVVAFQKGGKGLEENVAFERFRSCLARCARGVPEIHRSSRRFLMP